MEISTFGMKRESDRKCVSHARVHASAQSFDRPELRVLVLTKRHVGSGNETFSSPEAALLLVSPKNRDLWLHSGQTTGHSREHARDLRTSGHFPSSSHKISTVNLPHSRHLGTKFNHSARTNVLFPSFTA